MDPLHARLDTLESQVRTLTQHTQNATSRLRWWRGIACSLMVLGLLGWGLPAGLAREDDAEKDTGEKGLAHRVAALEKLLKHFSREKNEIFITGANLHLVNGLGSTDCTGEEENPIPDCPNGLGNLIVGYNEPRRFEENIRTGSHNVVVGEGHNFSRFGGLVVASFNTISGDFAAVSGGQHNTASGNFASVNGGEFNTANGGEAAVSGGSGNSASGDVSVVSGGEGNAASGLFASVSGGSDNTASGQWAAVSGGRFNTARGAFSSVSGGGANTGQEGNTASGLFASVSGGQGNEASGAFSSVSGGQNRMAEGEFDWVAGSLVEEE